MVQLLGFAGSMLIVLSVTMRSIVLLRIAGLGGSLTFICYGMALGAWPVVATNLVTTGIHLYRLRCLARDRSNGRRGDEQADQQPIITTAPPQQVAAPA